MTVQCIMDVTIRISKRTSAQNNYCNPHVCAEDCMNKHTVKINNLRWLLRHIHLLNFKTAKRLRSDLAYQQKLVATLMDIIPGSSLSEIVTTDTFGWSTTFEGCSSANGSNLNSNEKLSVSSAELSSMRVTLNDRRRLLLSKVRSS